MCKSVCVGRTGAEQSRRRSADSSCDLLVVVQVRLLQNRLDHLAASDRQDTIGVQQS